MTDLGSNWDTLKPHIGHVIRFEGTYPELTGTLVDGNQLPAEPYCAAHASVQVANTGTFWDNYDSPEYLVHRERWVCLTCEADEEPTLEKYIVQRLEELRPDYYGQHMKKHIAQDMIKIMEELVNGTD